MAAFKFQAQIVCYCVQAGSPAGFFAAFFPGKKARTLSRASPFPDFSQGGAQFSFAAPLRRKSVV